MMASAGALLFIMTGCVQPGMTPQEPLADQPGVSVPAEPGDVATWEVLGGASTDSTSIEVGVTRLGCAGGQTGTPLTPGVAYEPDRIIIEINVDPLDPDMAYTCQTNDMVPVTVDLSEPVGDRMLVDGACLMIAAGGTTVCDDPHGVRWP